MTLLQDAMAQLQEGWAASGRARRFESPQSCWARGESARPYAGIAARLNLTAPVVKMAVPSLRTRCRGIPHAETARTVLSREKIEEELRHLFSAFDT